MTTLAFPFFLQGSQEGAGPDPNAGDRKWTFYLLPSSLPAINWGQAVSVVVLPVTVTHESTEYVIAAAHASDGEHALVTTSVPQPGTWDGEIGSVRQLLREARAGHLWWVIDAAMRRSEDAEVRGQ